MNQAKQMAKIAYAALEEKKGIDIRLLDISQVSVIADYFLIATGNNANQVNALIDSVEEKMEEAGFALKQREGGGASPWVLLDYRDVIVHVFDPENRSFYALDRTWKDGKIVNPEDLA